MHIPFPPLRGRSLGLAVPLALLTGSAIAHEFVLLDALRYPGVFGRTLALDANADGRADVVTRMGDVPVVVFAPSIHQTTAAVVQCASFDVAVLEADDRFDRVLATTADGLLAYRYGQFANGGRPGYSSELLAGASFARAHSLAVADVDGDGHRDVVALDPTGTRVLRLMGGAAGTFAPAADVVLAAAAERVRVVRWTASGPARLALQRQGEVQVVALDGAIVDGFAFGDEVVGIEPLGEAATGADACAVLSRGSGAATRLTVLRAGAQVEGPFELGAIDGVALSVADVDTSGSDDVLVTSKADGFVRTLRHQGPGAATFAPAGVELIRVADASLDPSAQRANAVALDFDADGDLDLVQLVEASRSGTFVASESISGIHFRPTILETYLNFGALVPHVLVDSHVASMPDGSEPRFLVTELWGWQESTAPSYVGGGFSLLLGESVTPLAPGETQVVARVDAEAPAGDAMWVIQRCVGGTPAEPSFGVDGVWAYTDLSSDGGGTGGSGGGDGGGQDQNGESPLPPPPWLEDPPAGGGG